MDIELLTQDSSFLIKSLADLVNLEVKRIIVGGLVREDDLNKYINAEISEHIKKYSDTKDNFYITKCLSEMHVKLSSIKLPQDSDMIKCSEDKFYDPPKDPETLEEEEMLEELEEFIEQEDDEEIKDIAAVIFKSIQKIAHAEGSKGNHQAAFLIEKFLRSIKI